MLSSGAPTYTRKNDCGKPRDVHICNVIQTLKSFCMTSWSFRVFNTWDGRIGVSDFPP